MRAPTVLLAAAVLAATPAAEAVSPVDGAPALDAVETLGAVEVLFDHEPVSLLPTLRPRPDEVRVALHVLPARVPVDRDLRVVPLPVAWRVVPGDAAPLPELDAQERLVIDAEATRRLGAALSGIELGSLLSAGLRDAGHPLGAPLRPPDEAAVLERRPAAGRLPGPSAAAAIRALLRGAPGEEWALAGTTDVAAEADPTTATPTIAAPATLPSGSPRPRFVLQLDLVSLGLHLEGSSYPMTQRLLHATLRARLWDLDLGQRAWQRDVMTGVELPPAGQGPASLETTPSAARVIVAEAVRRALEPLWGADPPAGLRAARPAVGPPAAAAPPTADARLDEALALLARRRRAVADPDPWTALARSVRAEVDDDLGLVLQVAEDPLGSLVEVGSARLGLGLAETHRRVESSAAFRRALANDLVAELAQRRPSEPWLSEAVRQLLAPVGGGAEAPQPVPAGRALLERASAGDTVTVDSLAMLLIAARLWPEGSAELAARWAGPDPSTAAH